MVAHDVSKFANGLGQKLATRSRHVCVLLGAGASRSCGLPDIGGLETAISGALSGAQKSQFDALLAPRNLEGVLSRLRRISTLLDPASADTVDGIDSAAAAALDVEICRLIIETLESAKVDSDPMLRFAAWAARADYHLPLEIFTINYDLLIERGLEALGVPYFDGFVGALRSRFRTDLVEAPPNDTAAGLPAFMVRLWKLHGSVNWATDAEEVLRLGGPVPGGQPAAIYPSDTKYEESRRVPFVVLQDRFRRALAHPESLVLISGYSFGDAHLNEFLYDAARSRQRSELIVFSHGDIDPDLADRASRTPNLQVVSPKRARHRRRRRDLGNLARPNPRCVGVRRVPARELL